MVSGLVSIPVVGREVDRRGPTRPLLVMAAVYSAGAILCATAPSMPVFAASRLVQGYGGGGLFTLGYGVLGHVYPAALRPRMLALLSGVWVVSGLVGPGYGALMASTIGWRWAFVLVVPLVGLAIWLLRAPFAGLRGDPAVGRLPVGWPLLLAGGCSLALAGLGSASWLGVVPVAIGVAAMTPALVRILPAGWWRAAPGPAAALATSFLLNVGYFTADGFLPLLLTGVRGRSIAEAGIAVTLGSMSWFPGSWWQSRAAGRISAAALTCLGAALILAGLCLAAAALAGLWLPLVYAGWAVAGVGMGIAFNTVMLASMESAAASTLLSGRFVAGRLGIIAGTGIGGVFVAASHAAGRGLGAGLAGAFALSLAATVLSVIGARRLA